MQHQDNKFSGHVIFWKLNPSSSEQVLRGVTRKMWRGFFFSLATFCALTIAPGCYRITLYAFYWKLKRAYFSVAPCIMSRHDQVGLSPCANQTPALKKHLKTLGHSSCCWDCFIQRFHRLHGGYWCRFTRVQRLINTDVWFLEILEGVTRETREIISFHLRNIWPDLWEFSLKLAFFLQRGRKTSLFSLSPDVEHLFVKL